MARGRRLKNHKPPAAGCPAPLPALGNCAIVVSLYRHFAGTVTSGVNR